ncbi:hypothetical protein JRO89_XS05G0174900 [Xanthoceras sorbifolium]|uniref:THH1/TOM1/TOM3 domain-containing protein n=1 Tax=Xanthoceras sorbifolium TaxID=99658 RepID=A0ABQ8I2R9_9ROSI|nr:hypothetical protein JRO89_XS05G0174900 [Xanthoceras sorbifolium]
MDLPSAVIAFELKAANTWWQDINDSRLWQDRIFHVLAALYGLVAAVALVQLIRIQLRVPEYGWTTQKVFHFLNFLVNGVRCLVFVFRRNVQKLHPDILQHILLDMPSLAFFTTYALLVLFWAEIYYQARAVSTDGLRPSFFTINAVVYVIQAATSRRPRPGALTWSPRRMKVAVPPHANDANRGCPPQVEADWGGPRRHMLKRSERTLLVMPKHYSGELESRFGLLVERKWSRSRPSAVGTLGGLKPVEPPRTSLAGRDGADHCAEIALWLVLCWKPIRVVMILSKMFFAGVSLFAALGFLLYGGRLFLMLQRFPVESKGRRKKLQEVGYVTTICFTCFLVRCIMMCFNAFDKAADLDVLDHPVLNFIYYLCIWLVAIKSPLRELNNDRLKTRRENRLIDRLMGKNGDHKAPGMGPDFDELNSTGNRGVRLGGRVERGPLVVEQWFRDRDSEAEIGEGSDEEDRRFDWRPRDRMPVYEQQRGARRREAEFDVGGDITFFVGPFHFEEVASKTWYNTISSYTLKGMDWRW